MLRQSTSQLIVSVSDLKTCVANYIPWQQCVLGGFTTIVVCATRSYFLNYLKCENDSLGISLQALAFVRAELAAQFIQLLLTFT